MVKKKIRLIHWNETESAEKAKLVQAAGFAVDCGRITPSVLKEIRITPPDIIIIDLSRLPSQGRDLALNFRHYKSTRMIPLIFADGEPEKVKRIKKLLPDTIFTEWKSINMALHEALAAPRNNPLPAKSVFEAYAGTPLIKKLGIKSGMKLLIIDAPSGFIENLGRLPDDVKIMKKTQSPVPMVIWFVKEVGDLDRLKAISKIIAQNGGLWISWRKKAAAPESDLNQAVVRRAGLDINLVDFKICRIDDTWSALKFAWRKKK